MPDGYLKKQNKKIKKKKGHGASREMVENINTIRLLHGECRATNEEMKKFQKGDTIWGNDTSPEELKRWKFEEKEEAKKELSALRCRYARYNEHLTDVEEYALEFFQADESGEFVEGSDFELARMDFDSFQQEALKGNGVQNDAANVWVEVDGKQYTVDISDVLDHEEAEPFEASDALESDLAADAWTELYSQYLGE